VHTHTANSFSANSSTVFPLFFHVHEGEFAQQIHSSAEYSWQSCIWVLNIWFSSFAWLTTAFYNWTHTHKFSGLTITFS